MAGKLTGLPDPRVPPASDVEQRQDDDAGQVVALTGIVAPKRNASWDAWWQHCYRLGLDVEGLTAADVSRADLIRMADSGPAG